MVCEKAIWRAIRVVLPSLRSTCDMVHCLGKRALFSTSFVAVFFWQFLPSNTPITLYNNHYCWFFRSQGNRWTKYLAHPKIQRPKPCLHMFASLVILDGFHLLLSAQLTVHLTPEWNGRSTFHPLSHIYAKTRFCCVEAVANNALNHRCVVFDQLWTNVAPTLNTDFSWWIYCLLTSSTPLLSHVILIYDQPKQVCGVFCFPEHSASFVCTTAFKVSITPLNHCFQWSRVWITLIKPLLCLNSIFYHQKAMLY